jgi:ATP-dependent DNA helicase RecG
LFFANFSLSFILDHTTERDIDKIPSKRRNPVIADIFDRLKYMERRGSGFKKIREDYRGQYLYSESLKPEFYSDRGSFILTLKNLNYKKGAEKGAELRKAAIVEKRTEEIFRLIKENPELTQTDIMDKMNVSRKQVQNAIKVLSERGKIKRIGSNRSGYWNVNESN